MNAPGIWAAVPVKTLRHGKMRLAPALAPAQRRRLVLSMLDDVLDALVGTPSLHGIMVISPDRDVLAAAAHAGAVCVPQAGDIGLSPTANEAARLADALYRAAGIMIVPADLPAATPDDFEAIIAAHEAPGCTIAPAHDGGTNTILLSPPCAMGFLFGPGSTRRHVEAAAALGLRARIVERAALARDVDEPADLEMVCVS